MAKMEFSAPSKGENTPVSVERIEVRPWALGGQSHQEFSIGGGANFDATTNVLVEIAYYVNEVQFFYTRNFIHMFEAITSSDAEIPLERFAQGEFDSYGFGDMLPETSIFLRRDKHTFQDQNKEEQIHTSYDLEVSIDIGAVIGGTGPGQRMFDIKLQSVDGEEGIRFMRDLTREIAEVYAGRHPAPADGPDGVGDWQFVRQLNQKAYDVISQDYDEDYFTNPQLTEAFDAWLKNIPPGGHILDAGCGHGQPVISRLLEKGFCVTGTDLSPNMLERARENFPDITFLNQMTSEIAHEAEFDGVCSLSSLLYLDPIDLSRSLHRIHHALKPGGWLFLYAFDMHPGYRGIPYHVDINQWMWGWTYGIEEATQALEEHGYFKVLTAQNVSTEEEKQKRIENWRKYTQKQHEELAEHYPNVQIAQPDLSKPPSNLAYSYIIVARREP